MFTEDQVIGTESPQAPYNVIGNMDVLDITKQFNVPAEAENTNSRIRVIYHNAWSNKDCTANSTDLVDGMAYDVKVKVGQRSGIDSITGDATDAPAEFYNLQGIRMDETASPQAYTSCAREARLQKCLFDNPIPIITLTSGALPRGNAPFFTICPSVIENIVVPLHKLRPHNNIIYEKVLLLGSGALKIGQAGGI